MNELNYTLSVITITIGVLGLITVGIKLWMGRGRS